MAKTPFLEKTGSLRVLGAAFIAMMLLFVWLTYAFFNKQFVDSVPVTLTTSKSGMQLPSNADVKLKGMIVGEVRRVEPTADGVKMTLEMFPDMMARIPREVTAQIIPKTVFGEKYVALIPDTNLSGEELQAGDNIARAEVPIEVETLLNNLYPLLEAVQPAELSYTLTAISEAFAGRGDEIGASLIKLNEYFIEINPDIPLLVDDLVQLGEVSDGYADAMPDLGRFLKNSVVTGNTIVAKRAQMQAFFTEGIKLSDTTTRFLKDNGDNMITLAHEGQPFLQVLSDYSSTFTCLLGGINNLIPRLDSTYRDKTVHINLELIPETGQPTGYAMDEFSTAPTGKQAAENEATRPSCHTLPREEGDPLPDWSQAKPGPIPPFEVYKLSGIKGTHNKFCGRDDTSEQCQDQGHEVPEPPSLPRTAAQSLIDLVQPSVSTTDLASQREFIKALLGVRLGIRESDVPDIASLLVGPLMDGVGVRVSEAR